MGTPVAAYGFVIAVRVDVLGAVAIAFLCFPISADRHVGGVVAILFKSPVSL